MSRNKTRRDRIVTLIKQMENYMENIFMNLIEIETIANYESPLLLQKVEELKQLMLITEQGVQIFKAGV